MDEMLRKKRRNSASKGRGWLDHTKVWQAWPGPELRERRWQESSHPAYPRPSPHTHEHTALWCRLDYYPAEETEAQRVSDNSTASR